MKKNIIFLVSFTLLCTTFVYTQNEEIYNKSVGACITVYGIYYNQKGLPENYSVGTGFFVGSKEDGTFATALHVVQGANEVLIDYGYKPGIMPSDFINLTQAYPLETRKKYFWVDESRDLIIFKISLLYPEKALSLNTELPLQGEAIHAIGNTFGNYTMKFSSGQISQIVEGSKMKWIISEFTGLGGGNSGGPVLNKYGDVVGLVDMQDTRNNTIIWIVPSLYINFLLEDIKLRSGSSEIGEQLDDMIITPDIYSNLKPYDAEKFKKK